VIQTLTLFLGSLPPQVGCGYLSGQAQNLLLSYILSLSRSHKLVSQNGDPLGCSGHLIMGGCEQLSFLSGDLLRLDSTSPHQYDSGLCSSHLLPKLRHHACVLS
jgi:hypothetical protein